MDSPTPVLDLADLTAQLDAWRQLHRKRAPIPAHFYTAAVALLDRYSVAAICRYTRLRPASFKKHLAPRTAAAPVAPQTPPFLHLSAAELVARHPAPAADSHARLLFERADGSRLTLHLPTADPAQLHALCATLLRS